MSCNECHRPVIARGLCTKHYQRWHRQNRHEVRESFRGMRAIERLLMRCIETGDGCWEYQGAKTAGYARLRGDDGAKVSGHRLAWESLRGPIPDGLTFDHLCQNRGCVNPWHGDLVPMLVNVYRATKGTAHENRQKTHCPKGHPLEGDNLVRSSRNGRVCRTCRAETNRRYRARKSMEAAA